MACLSRQSPLSSVLVYLHGEQAQWLLKLIRERNDAL